MFSEKLNGDHHQASKQPMVLHPQPSQHPLSLPIQRLFWGNTWNLNPKNRKHTHTHTHTHLQIQHLRSRITFPHVSREFNSWILVSSDTRISSTLARFLLYCRFCATVVLDSHNPRFLHHRSLIIRFLQRLLITYPESPHLDPLQFPIYGSLPARCQKRCHDTIAPWFLIEIARKHDCEVSLSLSKISLVDHYCMDLGRRNVSSLNCLPAHYDLSIDCKRINQTAKSLSKFARMPLQMVRFWLHKSGFQLWIHKVHLLVCICHCILCGRDEWRIITKIVFFSLLCCCFLDQLWCQGGKVT